MVAALLAIPAHAETRPGQPRGAVEKSQDGAAKPQPGATKTKPPADKAKPFVGGTTEGTGI